MKMSNWVIILADKHEKQKIDLPLLEEKDNYQVFSFKKNKLIFYYSGIGLINAAAELQKAIILFNPKVVINYGAVGGTNKTKLFDLVIPNKFFCHDAQTPWYSRGVIPGEKQYYQNLFSNSNLNISSGNNFINKLQEVKEINKDYEVDLFDMESFSYALVSKKNNVPFLSIKCISDIIGSTTSNLEKINNNINKASYKALKWLFKNYELIESKL